MRIVMLAASVLVAACQPAPAPLATATPAPAWVPAGTPNLSPEEHRVALDKAAGAFVACVTSTAAQIAGLNATDIALATMALSMCKAEQRPILGHACALDLCPEYPTRIERQAVTAARAAIMARR